METALPVFNFCVLMFSSHIQGQPYDIHYSKMYTWGYANDTCSQNGRRLPNKNDCNVKWCELVSQPAVNISFWTANYKSRWWLFKGCYVVQNDTSAIKAIGDSRECVDMCLKATVSAKQIAYGQHQHQCICDDFTTTGTMSDFFNCQSSQNVLDLHYWIYEVIECIKSIPEQLKLCGNRSPLAMIDCSKNGYQDFQLWQKDNQVLPYNCLTVFCTNDQAVIIYKRCDKGTNGFICIMPNKTWQYEPTTVPVTSSDGNILRSDSQHSNVTDRVFDERSTKDSDSILPQTTTGSITNPEVTYFSNRTPMTTLKSQTQSTQTLHQVVPIIGSIAGGLLLIIIIIVFVVCRIRGKIQGDRKEFEGIEIPDINDSNHNDMVQEGNPRNIRLQNNQTYDIQAPNEMIIGRQQSFNTVYSSVQKSRKINEDQSEKSASKTEETEEDMYDKLHQDRTYDSNSFNGNLYDTSVGAIDLHDPSYSTTAHVQIHQDVEGDYDIHIQH